MKEIKIKAYEFKELPDEIQKKLIEKTREMFYETLGMDIWEESIKEKLECLGFEDIKFDYDLSYCQGRFDFDAKLNINKFLLCNPDLYKKYCSLFNRYVLFITIKKGRVYLESEEEMNENKKEQLREYLQDYYNELTLKLVKEGHKYIEDETSEERAKEYLADKYYTKEGWLIPLN